MAKIAKPTSGDKFNSDVWSSLDRGLTITDNMDGAILTVITDGTYPILATWPNKNRPTVAWIGQLREVSENHTTLTTAPYLDWEMSADGKFKVNGIAGISPSSSNRFYCRIVALSS